MAKFREAVAAMRLELLTAEDKNEKLHTLVEEAVRYRAALEYYANPENWLDGSPMLNQFEHEDRGMTAQVALRRIDLIGAPLVRTPQGEEVLSGG